MTLELPPGTHAEVHVAEAVEVDAQASPVKVPKKHLQSTSLFLATRISQ